MFLEFLRHQYKFLYVLYSKYIDYKYFKKGKSLVYNNEGYYRLTPPIQEKILNNYYKKNYRISRSAGFTKSLIDERAILHYNFLENYLASEHINFLNIGSSSGGISHLIHKHKNIEIFNLDPSEVKQYYKNKWNYLNSLDEINFKIDFLYMSHSLEHFSDVKKFLEKINSFFHEKTKVFIEVPNAKHKKAGNSGQDIKPPHTYYFEKKFFSDLNSKKISLFLTNLKNINKKIIYDKDDKEACANEENYKFIIYFGEGYFKL